MYFHDADQIIALHRDALLRESQHQRLVVALEVAQRLRRTGPLTHARYAIGRWMVVFGLRLQAFPTELTMVEYRIQPVGTSECL